MMPKFKSSCEEACKFNKCECKHFINDLSQNRASPTGSLLCHLHIYKACNVLVELPLYLVRYLTIHWGRSSEYKVRSSLFETYAYVYSNTYSNINIDHAFRQSSDDCHKHSCSHGLWLYMCNSQFGARILLHHSI